MHDIIPSHRIIRRNQSGRETDSDIPATEDSFNQIDRLGEESVQAALVPVRQFRRGRSEADDDVPQSRVRLNDQTICVADMGSRNLYEQIVTVKWFFVRTRTCIKRLCVAQPFRMNTKQPLRELACKWGELRRAER